MVINKNRLKKILKMTQEELKSFCYNELQRITDSYLINEDGFLYKEGKECLLVAHLDTVYSNPPQKIKIDEYGDWYSETGIGGDDRCGIEIILSLLENSHKDVGVLFCEDEESGGIGAYKFTDYLKDENLIDDIRMRYKAIIEVDRRNFDEAVFYGCSNNSFKQLVSIFYVIKEGSFSDISILAPALDIAAANVSAGYEHEHMESYETLNPSCMNVAINKLESLLNQISVNKHFTYDGKERYYIVMSDESIFEIKAVSEDEAVGKFLKEHPFVSYCDISQISTINQAPNSQLRATNIQWDTDGKEIPFLPTVVIIPDELSAQTDIISDWLSDEYGFCHKGFELVKLTNEEMIKEEENLKRAIFEAGVDAVEDFLDCELDGEFDIWATMDDVIVQMPDEEYIKYLLLYNII